LPWDSGVLFENSENLVVFFINYFCFRSHRCIVGRFSAVFAVDS
jgi:hypothetical protein